MAFTFVFSLFPTALAAARESFRENLSSAWGIRDREGLMELIGRMTLHGHNDSFQEAAAIAQSLSEEDMGALLAVSSETDRYMWPYTKYLAEKWGDKGILAWDLFRISNLVQWGYTAGYISYEEALTLLEPAAVKLSESFSSWDEAYENYLDGYHWWERSDARGQDIWQTERGKLYQGMKADPKLDGLFDDSLFETGVIPLPEKP